jgi:hypothetical protein
MKLFKIIVIILHFEIKRHYKFNENNQTKNILNYIMYMCNQFYYEST